MDIVVDTMSDQNGPNSPGSTSRPTRISLDENAPITDLGSYSDLTTAVNTPFAMTPGGSHHDLHEPPAWQHDVRASRHSVLSSTSTVEASHSASKDASTSDKAITDEMALKREVTQQGSLRHCGDSEISESVVGDGVLERVQNVDLGNGPEPVVIVDWIPDDPEVCLVYFLHRK